MESANGSRWDKQAVIYEMIMNAELPKKAMKYFLENADYIESSNENEVKAYYTAEQLQKFEKMYSEIIEGFLNKLVMSHVDKEEFYDKIWESLIDSDVIVEGKDEKIFALAKIWSDPRIPYFCVKEGMKMSNDEFGNIIKENNSLFKEVSFILACKYEQRTESSSLLLNIIHRCKDEREQTVVMAHILDMVERKTLLQFLQNR